MDCSGRGVRHRRLRADRLGGGDPRSHWRIGQDESDTTCAYVAHGPYRFLRHPIYWGMTLSALGQMLPTAGELRGLILLVGTAAYGLLQARAESHRWRNRFDDEELPVKIGFFSRSGTWSSEEIAGWQQGAGLVPRRPIRMWMGPDWQS